MILIIGAGDVGSNIAADLAETHEVTVIDRDAARVEALTTHHDVRGLVGEGRSIRTLREANIDDADIVVASTDSDAANVMVCNAAKRSGDPHTIARVKDVGLYRTWQSTAGGLGVDTMLCIDVLAADAVVQTLALPGAQAADFFADGQVEVAQFEVGADTPVTDRSVAEIDHYPSITFASLLREDDLIIPDGDTTVRAGDRVVVIGSPHGVSQFSKAISTKATLDADDDVVVVGRRTLGTQIAQRFEQRGWTPRIVDRGDGTASDAGTGATGSPPSADSVLGFDLDRVTGADLVVGAADDDANYLLAQLAHERGVAQTAAIVDDPEIVDLFEATDLDVVVHPEDIIVGEILQAVYGRGPEDVGVFDHDSGEVLEIEVDADSVLAGKPLDSATRQLPEGLVIGAIVRNSGLQTPRGGSIIQVGDHVIVFVDARVAEDVAARI